MKTIENRIRKANAPILSTLISAAVAAFPLMFQEGVLGWVGRILLFVVILLVQVIGNPVKAFRRQMAAQKIDAQALSKDMETALPLGKCIEAGTEYLIFYDAVCSQVIRYGSIVWFYCSESKHGFLGHFITHQNQKYTIPIEGKEHIRIIAHRMEEKFPGILFGYHAELAKAREENPAVLQDGYVLRTVERISDVKLDFDTRQKEEDSETP